MKYRSKFLELHSFVKITVLLKVTRCILQMNNVNYVILFVSERHKITNIHNKLFYAFFLVIPRRLSFICRRFGILCLYHLHRQVGVE